MSSHPTILQNVRRVFSLANLQVKKAQDMIVKAGPPNTVLGLEGLLELHCSINYFCCHTPEQQQQIREALKTFQWTSFTIEFDSFGCNLDVHHNTSTHQAAFLHPIASKASQAVMANFTASIENHLRSFGIPIYNPRDKAGPLFHITAASVTTDFPVDTVVSELSKIHYGNAAVCWFELNQEDGKGGTNLAFYPATDFWRCEL
jgi:hypothetical protein